LNLGTLPIFTQHPMDITINLINHNTNVSLTCEANDTLSYSWQKQNDDISSDSIGLNTNTLILVNLRPEDAGNYQCVATNADGNRDSDYATVTIFSEWLNYIWLKIKTSEIKLNKQPQINYTTLKYCRLQLLGVHGY